MTTKPVTLEVPRGRGTQKLYLCADGVYRSLGPSMRAYRNRAR